MQIDVTLPNPPNGCTWCARWGASSGTTCNNLVSTAWLWNDISGIAGTHCLTQVNNGAFASCCWSCSIPVDIDVYTTTCGICDCTNYGSLDGCTHTHISSVTLEVCTTYIPGLGAVPQASVNINDGFCWDAAGILNANGFLETPKVALPCSGSVTLPNHAFWYRSFFAMYDSYSGTWGYSTSPCCDGTSSGFCFCNWQEPCATGPCPPPGYLVGGSVTITIPPGAGVCP